MIKKTTQERLLQGLIEEVNKHSHTEELLNIMQEQVLDDTYLVQKGSHL
jgi:hypothetical protein